VGKCFASMESIMLLSEIHPDAQHALSFNALRQAQQWHHLLVQMNWQKTDFVDAIRHIQHAACEQGKQLILRDWSHVDYLGPPVTNEPKLKPALLQTLAAHFQLKTIQLVRHPLDTWLSLRRLTLIKKHGISFEQFLKAYRLYIENTSSMHRFVYEDFLAAPTEQLDIACQAVGLNFDQSYQDRWFEYDKITGDTSNQGSLRKKQTISLRPRRRCEGIDPQWLAKQGDYQYIINTIYPDKD